MTLGELIDKLASADPNKVVPKGFHNPHSYRGSYDELAFEPTDGITAGEMLEVAQSAMYEKYHGWKGGVYLMDEYTPVNIAEVGCCGEEISGLLMDYMLGNLT